MKLKIKDIEKKLGKKLKHNCFCLGVDTAATTGLAMITTTETDFLLEDNIFKLPSLPRKIANQMKKAEKYEQQLESMLVAISEIKTQIKQEIRDEKIGTDDRILIIEQSYMFNNPETFGILRAEQGIVYAELYDYFPIIKIWLPTVVRKLVGFQSVYSRSDLQHLKSAKRTEKKKEEIVNWVNNKLETKIENDNIADAIILALAGLLK